MHNGVYRELLHLINREGISYALLRDNLDGSQHIKDLDLLVDSRQMGRFQTLAREQGFFLLKDGYLNPGKKVFLRPCGDTSYVVDVHEMMVCRGVEFLDSRQLLQRRVKNGEFYQLSEEDYLVSLLFHNILAKRQIQKKHAPQLRDLFSRDIDTGYIERHLKKFGLARVYRELQQHFDAFAKDTARAAAISNRAFRKLYLRKPANGFRVAKVRWRKALVKIAGRRRGLVIAFLGPDGSGKSTTIKGVQSHLQKMGFNARVAYMGPWGGSMFHFKERLKWLNPDPYREDYKAYYAGKRQGKPGPLHGSKKVRLLFRSAIYYVLLLIEMAGRWFVRVLPHLRRGRIVLADRYLYDMLVGYKNRPMDYQVGIRRAICAHFPRPDIGILLDAAPEIIAARKAQLDREQLHAIQRLYQQVAKEYDFITLDTSTSLEDTLNQFDRKILPLIEDRLHAKMSH